MINSQKTIKIDESDAIYKPKKHLDKFLIFFVVTIILCGWLGRIIDSILGQKTSIDPADGISNSSLGMLIWIITPALMSILYIKFRNQDNNDFRLSFHFKKNKKGYFLALIIFPLMVVSSLLIGIIFGIVQFSENIDMGINEFITIFLTTIGLTLFKNIFEEIIFRGFLTTKIESIKNNPFYINTLTGLIWALWHIPYFLFVVGYFNLEEGSINYFFTIILFILGCISFSFVFYSIRLKTNSIWPGVLMHTTGGAFSAACILSNNFLIFNPSFNWISYPTIESVIMICVCSIIAAAFIRSMKKSKKFDKE